MIIKIKYDITPVRKANQPSNKFILFIEHVALHAGRLKCIILSSPEMNVKKQGSHLSSNMNKRLKLGTLTVFIYHYVHKLIGAVVTVRHLSNQCLLNSCISFCVYYLYKMD